jgi:hypothetical protein
MLSIQGSGFFGKNPSLHDAEEDGYAFNQRVRSPTCLGSLTRPMLSRSNRSARKYLVSERAHAANLSRASFLSIIGRVCGLVGSGKLSTQWLLCRNSSTGCYMVVARLIEEGEKMVFVPYSEKATSNAFTVSFPSKILIQTTTTEE